MGGSRTGSWSAKKSSDGYLIAEMRQLRTDSGTPESGTSVTYHRVFSDPKLAAPIPFDQQSLGPWTLGRSWAASWRPRLIVGRGLWLVQYCGVAGTFREQLIAVFGVAVVTQRSAMQIILSRDLTRSVVMKTLNGNSLNELSRSSGSRLAQNGHSPPLPMGNASRPARQIWRASYISPECTCLVHSRHRIDKIWSSLGQDVRPAIAPIMQQPPKGHGFQKRNSDRSSDGSSTGLLPSLFSLCLMSRQTNCPPHSFFKGPPCALAVFADLNTQHQPAIPQLGVQPNRESGTR
jgi:hypothetical protein